MEKIVLEESDSFWDKMKDMKNGIHSVPVEVKAENEKKPKVTFKKGSHKYEMYKTLKKLKIRKSVTKFHEKRLMNLAVGTAQKDSCKEFNTPINPSGINTKKSYVMINCADNIFLRVDIASYLKLKKLRKVIIETKWCVRDDGADEYDTIYSDRRTFDTINGLLRAMTEERIRCDCVYETQIKSCGFSLYDFRYKIMTLSKSGEYKFYKNINKFCLDYGIKLI